MHNLEHAHVFEGFLASICGVETVSVWNFMDQIFFSSSLVCLNVIESESHVSLMETFHIFILFTLTKLAFKKQVIFISSR